MLTSTVKKIFVVFVGLVSCAALLSAACVSGSSNSGCLQFEWKTSGATDQYTNAPTSAQQSWMQSHMYRIMGYAPYWNSRTSWFSNSWFYQDSSGLYTWASISTQHPEWILRNQYGTQLYINWGCSNGTCPQYAPDYSNENFRQWWIGQARQNLAAGYKGIFIDDVNMVLNVSNGSSQDTPIDPNTGQPMTEQVWNKYLAGFLAEVRQALPNAELCHNAIWYAGNADPKSNPYVAQEIQAANYINLERGFADSGLTGNGGFWSIQNMFNYIDEVHSLGAHVLPEQYGFDDEFSAAAYFLINDGHDAFANDSVTPANWPAVYDVNLGSANGARYNWNGLIRRDFSNGIVLLNPPNNATVTVQLPASYVDVNGNVLSSITLNGREGAVLTVYAAANGPVPNGTYVMKNQASQLVLADPASSTKAGTQMVQWNAGGYRDQSWIFASNGSGYYTIQNAFSGLFLTGYGPNGATLQQQPASNNDRQLWQLKPSGSSYMMVNKSTGLAIDDPGSSTVPGMGIVNWTPNGGANQLWSLQ